MSEKFPAPAEISADGTQKKGTVDNFIDNRAPLDGVFVEAFHGLAESDPRSLGRDAGPKFTTTIVKHLSSEKDQLQRKLSIKEEQLDSLRIELENSRIETTRLTEKLSAVKSITRLGQWTGFIGGPTLGIAIDLSKTNLNTGILLCALSIFILLLPITVNLRRKAR